MARAFPLTSVKRGTERNHAYAWKTMRLKSRGPIYHEHLGHLQSHNTLAPACQNVCPTSGKMANGASSFVAAEPWEVERECLWIIVWQLNTFLLSLHQRDTRVPCVHWNTFRALHQGCTVILSIALHWTRWMLLHVIPSTKDLGCQSHTSPHSAF